MLKVIKQLLLLLLMTMRMMVGMRMRVQLKWTKAPMLMANWPMKQDELGVMMMMMMTMMRVILKEV